MDQSPYKDALLRKRGEILSTGGGVKPLPATMEVNSRQGDLADQASGNNAAPATRGKVAATLLPYMIWHPILGRVGGAHASRK